MTQPDNREREAARVAIGLCSCRFAAQCKPCMIAVRDKPGTLHSDTLCVNCEAIYKGLIYLTCVIKLLYFQVLAPC